MKKWLDDQYAPLLILRFPESYGYDELDAAMTHLEETLSQIMKKDTAPRLGMVIDLTSVSKSSAHNRNRVVDSFKKMGPILSKNIVGQAFIAKNAILNGALTALFWMVRPSWSTKVFTDHSKAMIWLGRQFEEQGVEMPRPEPWW